tara:strand:+ start:2161 stop:2946 length:786 start_codon:yes stop_codon:yes gene_type:complete
MFGTYFYHQRIRKTVAVFGSLFNNIYVLRKDAAGGVISQVKVPLSYAPKRDFLDRISNMAKGEDAERQLSIKLPRLSFEITNFAYDAQRQLTKSNNYNLAGTSTTNRSKFYSPVPYNINFQLNVYAKTQDDALQIVEQIVPYFNPQYTLTVKPVTDFPAIKEDTPIILNSISFTDDYEGSLEQRRSIIYTLDFDMKISFYGPINTQGIIRQADAVIYNMNTGLADSDILIETIRVTPNPSDVGPDSDFGFTETYYGALDSA